MWLLWPLPENITRQRTWFPLKILKGCIVTHLWFSFFSSSQSSPLPANTFFWTIHFFCNWWTGVSHHEPRFGQCLSFHSKLLFQFSSGLELFQSNSLRCSIAISCVHRSPRLIQTLVLYLVFSCGWFALNLRKNNLPTFFFFKQFFGFVDKAINFLLPFLLTAWQVRLCLKQVPLFLSLILLVCTYFCSRDSSLGMSPPFLSRFCSNFFLLQSKVSCFF